MEETKVEKKKKPILIIILGVLALVAIAAAGYFFYKYQSANKMLTDPTAVNAEEAKKLTDKISKFYILPSDETPSVATVLDIDKLKDQPFFKDAQNGDKVLIYQKAGIAILYRSETNKIITVSSVSNASSESTTGSVTDTATPVAVEQPTQTVAPTASPAITK